MVNGLSNVALGEMVDIHGIRGLVLSIDVLTVQVVVFGEDTLIYQGDVVVKLDELMQAPIG